MSHVWQACPVTSQRRDRRLTIRGRLLGEYVSRGPRSMSPAGRRFRDNVGVHILSKGARRRARDVRQNLGDEASANLGEGLVSVSDGSRGGRAAVAGAGPRGRGRARHGGRAGAETTLGGVTGLAHVWLRSHKPIGVLAVPVGPAPRARQGRLVGQGAGASQRAQVWRPGRGRHVCSASGHEAAPVAREPSVTEPPGTRGSDLGLPSDDPV